MAVRHAKTPENGRTKNASQLLMVTSMHNKEEAKRQYEELYNSESQHEIYEILVADGRQFCCSIARKIDKPLEETRWHLEQMVTRGEITYKMGSYGV